MKGKYIKFDTMGVAHSSIRNILARISRKDKLIILLLIAAVKGLCLGQDGERKFGMRK
jgi:hypothetical protein